MLRKLVYLLQISLFLLLAGPVHAEQAGAAPALPPDDGQGRIAVATNSNDDTAPISSQIGQASHFIVYSNDGKYLETIAPPPAADLRAVLALLMEHGVTVVLAGHFDGKALELLGSADIIPLDKQGTVKDAVISLLQCEPNPPLEESPAPGAEAPR